jgi:hypothetical protein
LPLDTEPSDDDGAAYREQVVDLGPPASPRANDPYTVSQASNSISINDQTPGSVVSAEHAEDDTMAQVRPSRYVGYLFHDWKEEDVWSSWKHIVSKGELYDHSAKTGERSLASLDEVEVSVKDRAP